MLYVMCVVIFVVVVVVVVVLLFVLGLFIVLVLTLGIVQRYENALASRCDLKVLFIIY